MYQGFPEDLLEKARTEINEDPTRTIGDLEHIKLWLDQQPHLNVRQDDQWLLAFLRGCKFSLERTKEKLDLYYTMKTLAPEFYLNRNTSSSEIIDVIKEGIFVALYKNVSNLRPRFIIIRNGIYDPNKFSFIQIMKTNMMLIEMGLIEDICAPVNGIEIFLDMKGLTLAHMPPLALLKKSIICYQDAYPLRIKGIHLMNTPMFFDQFYGMLKPFLSEKIQHRVHTYGNDIDEFFRVTGTKEIFPKEYGGNGETIESIIETSLEKLEKYHTWFEEDGQYITDESKRVGPSKRREDETFGIEGSFRKLNVD